MLVTASTLRCRSTDSVARVTLNSFRMIDNIDHVLFAPQAVTEEEVHVLLKDCLRCCFRISDTSFDHVPRFEINLIVCPMVGVEVRRFVQQA